MARIVHTTVAASILLSSICSGSSSGNGYVCQHPPYKTHLVSSSPLVVYITGFVTPEERRHLKEVTQDMFAKSTVAERGKSDGQEVHTVRSSRSTNIPNDDIVRCIEERALQYQGLLDDCANARLEPLQLVKYGNGEHYHFHTDWFTDPVHASPEVGGNRLSSFFVYIHVSNGSGTSMEQGQLGSPERLYGGGTNFPLLNAPIGETWCEFIDCDEPWENGITFRPVEGNAVYWDNMIPGGGDLGDLRTLHAGLPVAGGEKIGMNIWTRQENLPSNLRAAFK